MKKIILFLGFNMLFHGLWAQMEDAQVWTSISLEKKLSPRFSFTLSPEVRFIENVNQLGASFVDGGLSYKLSKAIKLSAAYRISNKWDSNEGFERRNRFMTDLDLRYKIKPFILMNRLRYQSQYAESYFPEQRDQGPKNYLRERLMLKLDLDRRISPFLSGELFYHLNHPLENGVYNFDNLRTALGFNYEVNTWFTLGLSYLIQQEFNVVAPMRDYVAAIDLKLSF